MALGIERYERMLIGVDQKSKLAIKAEVQDKDKGEFAKNMIEGLKQAYTNVNSVLHREGEDPKVNKKDIKRNKTLFNQLLKIAEKEDVDLSDLKNELIDRLERDLRAYKSSGKTMDDEKHPLYKMGEAFIQHDIKAEAKQIGKGAKSVIENAPKENAKTPQKRESGRLR